MVDEKPKSPTLPRAKDTPGQQQGPLPVKPDQPWTDRNAAAFPNTKLFTQDGKLIERKKS